MSIVSLSTFLLKYIYKSEWTKLNAENVCDDYRGAYQ